MDKWEQIAQIRSDRIEELTARTEELEQRLRQRDQLIEQYKDLTTNLLKDRDSNE